MVINDQLTSWYSSQDTEEVRWVSMWLSGGEFSGRRAARAKVLGGCGLEAEEGQKGMRAECAGLLGL